MTEELSQKQQCNNYLAVNNPQKIEEKYGNICTAAQSVNAHIASLASCIKQYSRQTVEDAISLLLIDLNVYFRDAQRMSPEQIKATSHLIYSDNYMLNFADLNIVFKRFKRGEIRLFGGIDGAVICHAIAEYRQEKFKAFAEREENFDMQLKENGAICKPLSISQIKQLYQILKTQYEDKRTDLAAREKAKRQLIKKNISLAEYILRKNDN